MEIHNSLYSFFFKADSEYLHKYKKNIVNRLLKVSEESNIKSRFYYGDLTLTFLASTISEVSVGGNGDKSKPTLSYTLTPNKDLLYSLSWELYDSLCSEYCTFDESFYPLLFVLEDIYVFSVSNIDENTAALIDSDLTGHGGYLGTAKCDLANPLHVDLFVGSMLSDWFLNEKVLYYMMRYDDSKSSYPHWAEELRVEIKGVDETDYNNMVPIVELMKPLSERGKLFVNVYIQRTNNLSSKVAKELLAKYFIGKSVDVKFTYNVNQQFSFRNVIIPRNKLTGYVLNKNHKKGGSKAILFERLLGITVEDSEYLSAQILEGLLNGVLQEVRATQYGFQYHVDIQVKGLNHETKTVRTAWILKDESTVSLVTAYILDTNKQKEITANDLIYIKNVYNNEEDYFRAIYELAKTKSEEALTNTIPVPFYISGYKTPVANGAFGWANIVIEGKSDFIKWLKKSKIGYKHYKKGWVISGPLTESSYDKQVAYAEMFSKILQVNGINNRVESKFD